MKSIIKELIISILLIIVIFLLLVVIFYEYMPISIVVPENVSSYKTPTEVKDEISQEIVAYTKQTQTYEISKYDIENSMLEGSYDASKAHPFYPCYEDYGSLDSDSGEKSVSGMEIVTPKDMEEPTTEAKNSINTKLK